MLGISLGTRLIGMAVIYEGTLTDFRVRTFYGAWTDAKRQSIIAMIGKTASRYKVSKIVLKTPIGAHCSQALQQLIRAIRELAGRLGVTLMVCTIQELKEHYNAAARNHKNVIIQSILAKYPQHLQLHTLYEKERTNKSSYHIKLFEAIACTEM